MRWPDPRPLLRHTPVRKTDRIPSEGEHASIEDMYIGTKVYANLILEVCNRTRKELGIEPRPHTPLEPHKH